MKGPRPLLPFEKGGYVPFTAYYVFGTAQTDATQWLEVGLASSGTPDGWIEAGKTSPWLQALTLKFTERTGRQPVLFFKDMVDLEAVAADRDPAGRYLDLMDRFPIFSPGTVRMLPRFPLSPWSPSGRPCPGINSTSCRSLGQRSCSKA
jgi:hypothetical protein